MTTNLAWDSLDRLLEERTRLDFLGHPERAVRYGRDALGRERRLGYPDGRTHTIDVDVLGRTTRVVSLAAPSMVSTTCHAG